MCHTSSHLSSKETTLSNLMVPKEVGEVNAAIWDMAYLTTGHGTTRGRTVPIITSRNKFKLGTIESMKHEGTEKHKENLVAGTLAGPSFGS